MSKENSNSERGLYELTEFGLTPLQVKVYITLVKLGAGRASEIARELNVSRTEIYPVLAGLQKLGLVEASLTKPTKFRPTPIESALSNLLDQMKSKVAELANKKKKIHSWLTSIEGKKAEAEERFTFNLLLGVQGVHTKVNNMVRSAEKEIDYVMCATCLLRILRSDVADELKKCVKRGVKVKIISEINDENIKDVEKFKDLFEFQHSDQQKTIHTMVVDEKETILGVATENLTPETNGYINLWTDNKYYVHAMKNLFGVLWRGSVDVNSRIDFLRIGKPIERFEVIRDKKTWLETILRMCRSAKKELIFITNKPGFLIGFKTGLADATVSCANRGVEVRSIVKIDEDLVDPVNQVIKYLKIRHSDQITTLMVIMDKEEMIFSPTPEDPSEWSWSRVWTNNLNLVKTMHAVFDQLWQSSIDAEEKINEIKTGKPVEWANTIRGRENIYKYTYDMFARAKSKSIVVIDSAALRFTVEDLKERGMQRFMEMMGRGVRSRCIVPVTKGNLEYAKILSLYSEVRHVDTVPLRVVLTESECMISPHPIAGVPEEAMYSNKPSVVSTVWQVVDSTWSNAIPVKERIRELEGR